MGTLSEKTKSGNFDYPNTKDDMEALDTWKYGVKLYGTFAKSCPGEKRYRRDIERAYGNEDDYDSNVVYINTFKGNLKDQLDKFG
jgi:hypothetical protein